MSNTTAVDRIAKIIAGPLLPVGEGDMALAADIVAAEIKPLTDALEAARRSHLVVDDCWYSCPKSGECCNEEADPSVCWCGADEHNARIDAALDRVRTPTERSANDGR